MRQVHQAYTAGMRKLPAVPVLALVLSMAAAAQRGGGGMHAGGATAGAHGGMAPAAHPMSPQTFGSGARYASAAPAGRQLFLPPGITSTRPVYYSNGIRRYGEPGGRAIRGGYGGVGYGLLGAGYGYAGYGFPAYGYDDFGFAYADSNAYDPLDPNNVQAYPAAVAYAPGSAQDAFPEAQAGVAPLPPAEGGAGEGVYSSPYAQEEPPIPYARYGEHSSRAAASPEVQHPAPPAEEDPVTIVFKDGRPNEHIRNYALTRTALYITTDRVRTVQLADIDLPATEKVNREAGVEFQLPSRP